MCSLSLSSVSAHCPSLTVSKPPVAMTPASVCCLAQQSTTVEKSPCRQIFGRSPLQYFALYTLKP